MKTYLMGYAYDNSLSDDGGENDYANTNGADYDHFNEEEAL